LPLLLEVVRILAIKAPGTNVEAELNHFDGLWTKAERWEALKLGQEFLFDGLDGDEWSGDRHD